MARVTFTNDQLLQVKIVPPQWYKLLVKSYEQTQAGTDGSDLHVFSIVIDDGPFKGVPVRLQGSEKFYSGEFIEFVEASLDEGLKAGVPVEFDKLVGKKIEGFIQRGEYKGKPQNMFVSFRKIK